MKLIQCILRPNKVDDVVEALRQMNVSGLTVSEVRGHGRQKGHTAIYRGTEYQVTLLPKMRIEIVAADSAVDEIIKTTIRAAGTGEIGDGRVFVLPVDETYKIRTGERNVAERVAGEHLRTQDDEVADEPTCGPREGARKQRVAHELVREHQRTILATR